MVLPTSHLATNSGLGVEGPGAVASVRAALVDFLSNGSGRTAEVIVAGAELAERLFPGVGPFPGYQVAGGLHAALTSLEVELVHRRRPTEGDDVADFAAVVARYPEEPLPTLVLVVETPDEAQRARLLEVLRTGKSLGVGALVLEPWEGLTGLRVAEDGVVASVPETAPAPAFTALACSR